MCHLVPPLQKVKTNEEIRNPILSRTRLYREPAFFSAPNICCYHFVEIGAVTAPDTGTNVEEREAPATAAEPVAEGSEGMREIVHI